LPEAGDGVDAALLDTIEHDTRKLVTFHGWPRYYFSGDEGAEAAQGNGVGTLAGDDIQIDWS